MKLIDMLVEELPKRGGWPIESNGCRQFPDGEVCFSNVGKKPDFYTECATDVDLVWRKTVTPHVSREQYEAALSAKNEGWIEWGGGECPVEKGTLIDVKWRDGRIDNGIQDKVSHGHESPNKRNAISWRHFGIAHDIIAYRLHQPQKAEQAKANLSECIGNCAAPDWSGEGFPPVGCECEFISSGISWGPVIVIGMDGDKVVIKPSGKTYYGITPSERQVFRPIRTEVERKREESVRVIYEILDAGTSTKQDAEDIYNAIESGKIPGVKLED